MSSVVVRKNLEEAGVDAHRSSLKDYEDRCSGWKGNGEILIEKGEIESVRVNPLYEHVAPEAKEGRGIMKGTLWEKETVAEEEVEKHCQIYAKKRMLACESRVQAGPPMRTNLKNEQRWRSHQRMCARKTGNAFY